MSWSLLERFLESEHFNNDPSLAVAYLSRYANHVGIQYVLCSKLRSFTYEEIEFFLPQLCHLLVSVENESMALEDFILDLCQESVSGALLTFWLFQTHLHDLSGTPHSNYFKTCRRIFMKVQNIVFGNAETLKAEKIHEHVLPVTVLASIVLAGVAAPFLPRDLGRLAVAQARKPQPLEDTISEAPPVRKVGRSHTIAGTNPRAKKITSQQQHSRADSDVHTQPNISAETRAQHVRAPSSSTQQIAAAAAPSSVASRLNRPNPKIQRVVSSPAPNGVPARNSTSSLPDFRAPSTAQLIESLGSSIKPMKASPADLRRTLGMVQATNNNNTDSNNNMIPNSIEHTTTRAQKIRMLRSNYFRNETQFLTALEGISIRLVSLPKPARLSALRAELALVARDLPCEVDIPLICPATLEDGSPSRSKHHRVVRINPAEATSLNSAERVPYLLMVEVLREDLDFNPDSEVNQRLLSSLLLPKDSSKRRPFDIEAAARDSIEFDEPAGPDSVFEPANGDLSSSDLLQTFVEKDSPRIDYGLLTEQRPTASLKPLSPRIPSAVNTGSSSPKFSTTPTSESYLSRSGSPALKLGASAYGSRSQGMDPPDISALATHMRTAAQMLAQLDLSSSKRPRREVELIKAKIIASMQTLEEQNFTDEVSAATTFDTIIADVERNSGNENISELNAEIDTPQDANLSSGAGAARMENDQKTGGVKRTGDRDDPSAATFGEEWKNKKERIRRSSPYGFMKNWDLLSVIVKTGSDLRQELFACQLIGICAKIWEDANVPVWVKRMRILVTGESSGLIETITNGVSLHSLKRSLTLSSISSGTNPRKRIATLQDHFTKAFGSDPESTEYKAARDAFTRSLAAYSILSYIIQLKDRHNGNILIDNAGHIIHIDFGFMLSNSPGGVGVEAAPFKLTQEYIDVLGGVGSAAFDSYKTLCKQAFQALRKSADNIVSVVEMMGKESKMACYASGVTYVTASLRQRFLLHLSKEEAESYVETDLIGKSLGSYYTRLYDTFQYRTQGIY